MTQLKICNATEIAEGAPFQAIIDGHDPYAVFMVDGAVYVVQDKCTHMEASLGLEGEQRGAQVVCGWHDGTFDVRTGEVISGPCPAGLRTFPARILDGQVVIDL